MIKERSKIVLIRTTIRKYKEPFLEAVGYGTVCYIGGRLIGKGIAKLFLKERKDCHLRVGVDSLYPDEVYIYTNSKTGCVGLKEDCAIDVAETIYKYVAEIRKGENNE